MTHSNSNISRHYHQLTAEQRGQIEALHNLHISNAEIARRLHCHRSTVGRELKRGSVLQRNTNYFFYTRYFSETAQTLHNKRRQRCRPKGLLKKAHFFFKLLTKQIRAPFSAKSIDEFVGRFKLTYPSYPCPSTPTVYRYIDRGLLSISNLDLPQKLSRRLKKHHRHHARQAIKHLGVSIEQRPKSVDSRLEPFHWEGDLVKGIRRKDQPALMTLTERKTRFEIVALIPNYHAHTCRIALQHIVDAHPKWFKTITFDNGAEFSELSQVRHTKIYFAHPYSPWERGTNENCNGLLRQFFPKGKPINQSPAYLQRATQAINDRPRRILSYHTARECLNQYLVS